MKYYPEFPSLKERLNEYYITVVTLILIASGFTIILGTLAGGLLRLGGAPTFTLPTPNGYSLEERTTQEGWVGEVQTLSYATGHFSWLLLYLTLSGITMVIAMNIILALLECYLEAMFLVPKLVAFLFNFNKK